MKSYIAYRNQLEGMKDVSQTVKTVEKIAASSVHILKQDVAALRAYASNVETTLSRLSVFYAGADHPLLRKKAAREKMLIVLTGNKGLVGGLWHTMTNVLLEHRRRYHALLVVGDKGKRYLEEENVSIAQSFRHFPDIAETEAIDRLAHDIFHIFNKNTFSTIDILYPHFISLAKQQPRLTPFLPFDFTPKREARDSAGLPIFEPSKRYFFDRLLNKYIQIFFRNIVMETHLSERAARTVAMEHAMTKTEELINKTMLRYTKHRRRMMTQGQLESFAAHKII